MTKIRKMDFNENGLCLYEGSIFHNDWPVVYILNGSRDAYIGQTTNFIRRMSNHLNTPSKRNNLDTSYRIEDETFNNSVTLDLESFLIEYISSDGKYKLLNGNAGLRHHNYYNKSSYREKFQEIWDLLRKENIVEHNLLEIQNSDIFKLSPFKSLSQEQYDIVLKIVKVLVNENYSKHIINGNPGTGKTVLAIYLIKYLIDTSIFKNKKIALVVPMTSLRNTIKKVFRQVKGLSPSMVIGPYDVKSNSNYDVLIVDESHRLTRYKMLSNNAAFKNKAMEFNLDYKTCTQLDWIKKSTNHLILFYDRNQTIKPSDIKATEFLDNLGEANAYNLRGQFRVKADFDYPKFIENLLNQNISELNKVKDTDLGSYDIKIFDNIENLEMEIRNKNSLFGLSRMVSGFAFKWDSKNDTTGKVFDIELQNRKYRWNSTTKDWINSKNAINEVGCIHTTQGYDLNYCGVIIGNDLIYKDGKILYNKEAFKDLRSKDNSIGGDMLSYIINIYKVLLTRGIFGTYIYVCDDNLRKYLKKYIPTYNNLTDNNNTYTTNSSNDLVAEDMGSYEK